MRFKTWEEASAYAQARADKEKRSFGIENLKSPLEPGRDWNVTSIPAKKFRFGHEALIEAVEPSRWEDVPEGSK